MAAEAPKNDKVVFDPASQSRKTTRAGEHIQKVKEIPDFAPPDIYVAKLEPKEVLHNLSVAELYEQAIAHEEGNFIVSTGALCAISGQKTGRSPKDKRVVKERDHADDIWWGEGSPNYEMDEYTFMVNRERAIDYLNTIGKVYVQDMFLSWDPKLRIKVRIVCARAYHALFMHNMCIRPTEEELKDFGEPAFTIYNAGHFPVNRLSKYMSSGTSVDIDLNRNEMVILGTEYAGEMKKGLFSLMNYLMPKQGVLSLHSGANMSKDGQVSLFFGLSGTGKTTLSTDPNRYLIGDDEHTWGDDGVANIEGGCYAKCINLSKENEPDIYNAIRFGSVVENVVFDPHTRVVDYNDGSITENTRVSYPIEYISNAKIPCVAGHATNVILLTCDAFGVLPPVSRLTLEQAMYHFISGYTAKVAGTEMGVTEPEATFSACFGAAFMMWHPYKYATLLAERIKKHGSTAWLVNTGWTGGAYGVGHRMSIKHTRAIIDAIHDGSLAKAETVTTPVFNLLVPTTCANVPNECLQPETLVRLAFHPWNPRFLTICSVNPCSSLRNLLMLWCCPAHLDPIPARLNLSHLPSPAVGGQGQVPRDVGEAGQAVSKELRQIHRVRDGRHLTAHPRCGARCRPRFVDESARFCYSLRAALHRHSRRLPVPRHSLRLATTEFTDGVLSRRKQSLPFREQSAPMDGFRAAVNEVAAILRRVLLRDPSNRREACTWLAALIGRVQLPPALRRALVCQLVARSGSLDPGKTWGKSAPLPRDTPIPHRRARLPAGGAQRIAGRCLFYPRRLWPLSQSAHAISLILPTALPHPPLFSHLSPTPIHPLELFPHPLSPPTSTPSPNPSKSSPGASDRSLLRQLLQLLCEERPKDAARLLMHDPDLIRSFFAVKLSQSSPPILPFPSHSSHPSLLTPLLLPCLTLSPPTPITHPSPIPPQQPILAAFSCGSTTSPWALAVKPYPPHLVSLLLSSPIVFSPHTHHPHIPSLPHPTANPRCILLWFDHFSMGPSPSIQGSRRGEEGERSREHQRPSAYAATAYAAAAAGSGSAQTKLAGSAAAGDALHRDSPGSGRLVLPTRNLVRNHRFGAQALAEFAFARREEHWHRLVWAGKHAQTPVTVAARPHYFCELDISGTMKNFLLEVPEFWSSHELRKTLRDGAFLSLDIGFFVEELMRRLIREMEDERRRREWEEGVEEVLHTVRRDRMERMERMERREREGRDVGEREGWRREEGVQTKMQMLIPEERRGRQGRELVYELVYELVEEFIDSVDWAVLCSRVLAGAGEEGLESVGRGVWQWVKGRRGEEGGGTDRRGGGRKREDDRERERGIERERGRLMEGGGDGWAGARERRGREGREIEMGVGVEMVEAQGMMDEVLIGVCWDGDEERSRGGRREEDEERSRRERRERDKERNSRRARDVKADHLASLPSLDSLSSFERLLLLVAGACHGRQTALLLLREPEWADEREELTAVLRGCFATSVGEPPGKQLLDCILESGGVERRRTEREGSRRDEEMEIERGRAWGEESMAGIEVVIGTWMVRAHLMASMGHDGGHMGMDDGGLAGMGCMAGGDEAVGVMLRRLGVAVERVGGEGGVGEVGGEGGAERVGDGEGVEKRRKRERKKEKKGGRGKVKRGGGKVSSKRRKRRSKRQERRERKKRKRRRRNESSSDGATSSSSASSSSSSPVSSDGTDMSDSEASSDEDRHSDKGEREREWGSESDRGRKSDKEGTSSNGESHRLRKRKQHRRGERRKEERRKEQEEEVVGGAAAWAGRKGLSERGGPPAASSDWKLLLGPLSVTCSMAAQGKTGSPQREASGRAKRVSVAEIYAVERLDEAVVKGSLLGPTVRLHRLAIHTFRKAADRWTPVQLVLSHADVGVCQQWVNSIQSLLRADPERPRNLLAFMNPIGGHRKALKTWAAVKPVFDRAGVAVTEVVTQRQNHAFDAVYGATDEEISAVDGILVVGGDGLFNEVLNGLAKRRHHAPPCIHPARLSSARLSLPPSSPISSTLPPLAPTGSPAALSSAALSSATPSSVKSSPPTSTSHSLTSLSPFRLLARPLRLSFSSSSSSPQRLGASAAAAAAIEPAPAVAGAETENRQGSSNNSQVKRVLLEEFSDEALPRGAAGDAGGAGGAVPTGGAAAAPPLAAAAAAADDAAAGANEGLFVNLGARSDGGQSIEEDGEREEARGCGNATETTILPDTQLGAQLGSQSGTAECVNVGLQLPHALRIGIIPAGSTDCIIMSMPLSVRHLLPRATISLILSIPNPNLLPSAAGSRDPTSAALHVVLGHCMLLSAPHLSSNAPNPQPPPHNSVTGSRDPTTAALHVVLGHRMPLDVARITTWKEEELTGKEGQQSEEEKETQHVSTEAQGLRKERQQAETGSWGSGGSGGREEGGEGQEQHVRGGAVAGAGREMVRGAESEAIVTKGTQEEEGNEGVEVRYAASFFGYVHVYILCCGRDLCVFSFLSLLQTQYRSLDKSSSASASSRIFPPISYGFYGDVIRRSEGLRWMGPARYDYAGLMAYLHHRSYDAEVSYFDMHSSAGPAPRPAIQASPVQAAAWEAPPFTAAGSQAAAVEPAAGLGESPSQGVLAPPLLAAASPLEAGPVRGLERSFTDQLPRTHGLDDDEEEEVGEVEDGEEKVGEEVVEEEGGVGGEGKGEVEGGGEGKGVGGGDGEVRGEEEGMPLQAVEWNGRLRRRTFSSPMLVKTRTSSRRSISSMRHSSFPDVCTAGCTVHASSTDLSQLANDSITNLPILSSVCLLRDSWYVQYRHKQQQHQTRQHEAQQLP
ncbi:unnamed protein product [Closterium sp. NIES-54]